MFRKCVRELSLFLLCWTGILRFWRFLRRHQIVFLTIHGVMDAADNATWEPFRRRLSPDKLADYMRVLSKCYRFVSLSDAVEMLRGSKPMLPYSLVLTFDDGYRNNLTHALPILRRYGAPATFFVPTGFLAKPRPFCNDRLDYALQQSSGQGQEVRFGELSIRLDSDRAVFQETFRRFRVKAKTLQLSDLEYQSKMDRLCTEWEDKSGKRLADILTDDDWSTLTWQQVSTIRGSDVTLGSHTVDHIRLGLVEAELARDQLVRSKRDIEIHTGKPCLTVCYPSGSFTDETIRIARECGYVCGVTTREGLNRIGDDSMKLRRINMPSDASCSNLLAITCGLSQTLSHVKGHLKNWCFRQNDHTGT